MPAPPLLSVWVGAVMGGTLAMPLDILHAADPVKLFFARVVLYIDRLELGSLRGLVRILVVGHL